MDEGLELINRLEALGLRDCEVDGLERVSVPFESLDKLLRRVERSLIVDDGKEPSLPVRTDQWETLVCVGEPRTADSDRPWWLLQVVPTEVKSWPGEPLKPQAVCLWVRRRSS